MKKIIIRKPFEEIEIGGEVFIMDLSDSARVKRSKDWAIILKDVDKLTKNMKLTEETKLEKLIDLYRKGINATLDGEPADKIYEMCGKDLVVLTDVLKQLQMVMQEHR